MGDDAKGTHPRTPVQIAMVALRQYHGWTQADLGVAMNIQLPSIGRWEATEPPTGLSLARLYRLAHQTYLTEVTLTFWQALVDEARTRPKTAALLNEIREWDSMHAAAVVLTRDARALHRKQPSALAKQVWAQADLLRSALSDRAWGVTPTPAGRAEPGGRGLRRQGPRRHVARLLRSTTHS